MSALIKSLPSKDISGIYTSPGDSDSPIASADSKTYSVTRNTNVVEQTSEEKKKDSDGNIMLMAEINYIVASPFKMQKIVLKSIPSKLTCVNARLSYCHIQL